MQMFEKMSTTTKLLLAGAVIGGVYFLTRKPKPPAVQPPEEEPESSGLGSTGPQGEPLFEFNVAPSITPAGTFFYAILYRPIPGTVLERVVTRIRTDEQGNRFTTRHQAAKSARQYIQTVLEGSAVCIGGCGNLPKGQILPPLDIPVS